MQNSTGGGGGVILAWPTSLRPTFCIFYALWITIQLSVLSLSSYYDKLLRIGNPWISNLQVIDEIKVQRMGVGGLPYSCLDNLPHS